MGQSALTGRTPRAVAAALTAPELRVRRQAMRLSQARLALALGVTTNTLARWERGVLHIANPTLVRLALERLETGGSRTGAHENVGQPAGPRHNLPAALTHLVGRQAEIRMVRQLHATHRLITLSGAAGVGKTRLALEVAHQLVSGFPDGVWLIDLAPLADAALLAGAVAAGQRLPIPAGRSILDALVEGVGEKQRLLVLDNCEHLAAACAHLVEALLGACPRLHILTTSRQSLGATGELTVGIAPLSLPAADAQTPSDLRRSEAVQLFVERARSDRPLFGLTRENARWIAAACREVDGLPLALELAAAQLQVLGLPQLVDRLEDRFRLLADPHRRSTAHHRTLQAAIDRSFDLLDLNERRLFGCLSVFTGSWTLDAAEAIGAFAGIERSAILHLLGQLINKSLVLAMPAVDGSVRYGMLETLRAYAWTTLGQSDREALLAEHARFYLNLAEQAEPRFIGADQEVWFARIEEALPNVRSALTWCAAHPGPGSATGLRTVGALVPFWQLGLHLREGHDWAEALLARAPAELKERTIGLWTRGFLAWHLGDRMEAQSAWEAGLPLARAYGQPRQLAHLLNGVGYARLNNGEWDAADRLLTEAVALSRASNDTWTAGFGLFAMALAEQARGNYEGARALLEESLEPLEQLGDRRNRSFFLLALGHLSLQLGEHDRADELFRAALESTSQVGDTAGIVWALEALLFVAGARRQPRQVARLLGVVETVRAQLGVTPDPVPGWSANRSLATGRTAEALGEEGLRGAVAAGRREVLTDVIAELLAPAPFALATRGARRAVDRVAVALTQREQEVALLVREGLTNRQIAQQLVVAAGTVQRHVANILGKLGYESRAQIAAWAMSLPPRPMSPGEPSSAGVLSPERATGRRGAATR